MRVKNWFAVSVVLPGLCLGALALSAQSQSGSGQQQSGDPVADAARRSRELQKTSPKPKKVYTDDDVKPATPASDAPAAGGGNQASAAAAGTDANGKTGKDKDDPETIWRKKFLDQHNKIAAAEKELDILQREADKAQIQYYNDPTKAMNEQFSRKDINDKNAKIDQKKQEIATLKQQFSDMEDELRKSGGDPGWAR